MYQDNELLEYLNTPQGINLVVILIIIIFIINAIFISYSINSYKDRINKIRKSALKLKDQKEKISKLYPKSIKSE